MAGLPYVDTIEWGGLMLDVIISFVAVAGSLPLGILLAFGRRSQLPVVRSLSIGYIELWRGVPLLTVLFMSAVLMPLFLPQGVSVDRLLRAMAALVLFNAAYMAEVVRGGLQGVDPGQDEAAYLARPALVAGAGLRRAAAGAAHRGAGHHQHGGRPVQGHHAGDDHRPVRPAGRGGAGLKDPAWLGFANEGYVFSALVFFVCCLCHVGLRPQHGTTARQGAVIPRTEGIYSPIPWPAPPRRGSSSPVMTVLSPVMAGLARA